MRICLASSARHYSTKVIEVASVHSLRLDGLATGALFELAQGDYDLFLTRDAEFARRARSSQPSSPLKLILVVIPQTRQDPFVAQFMAAFRVTDWTQFASGDEWPRS